METANVNDNVKPVAGLNKPATAIETVCLDELRILKEAGLPPSFVTDGFFVKPKDQDMRIKIYYKEIVWIESQCNYSHIHLKDKSCITVIFNLGKVEKILPIRYFVRVNRCEIINIHYVDRICGNMLRIGKHSFTVNESAYSYVFSCFNELSKG